MRAKLRIIIIFVKNRFANLNLSVNREILFPRTICPVCGTALYLLL